MVTELKTAEKIDPTTAEFQRALSHGGDSRYVLRLYLTGSTRRSIQSVNSIKTLCERYLRGRYDLEVIDLYQQPERADAAQIFAAPTLVKELPLPLGRLVGDLTDSHRVLIALKVNPEAEDALNAIRKGEVDGLLIAGPEGRQVFTLHGTQEPYRLLIEQMSEGALTLSEAGFILYANQPMADLLQMPLERLIGAEFRAFVAATDQPALAELIGKAWDGGSRGELSFRVADGSSVPLRLGLSRLSLGAEETLVSVVATNLTEARKKEAELRQLHAVLEQRVLERTADLAAARLSALKLMEEAIDARQASETANQALKLEITERIRAEAAVGESEERFHAIADNIPQLAWMADGEGHFSWFNRAWFTYTGTTLKDNLGDGWKAVYHPDYVQGASAKLEHSLRDGLDWEDTFPLRGQDGQYRWFLSRMNGIRDESGKVVRFFGTNTDVTALREAQTRLAEALDIIARRAEELEKTVAERTGKLRETIGELEAFSYSISHDMRAPLRAMQSFADILIQECSDQLSEDGKEYIRRIATAAERMDALIRDLLVYSRVVRADLPLDDVDLSALLRGIVEDYPQFNAAGADISIIHPLPHVRGNASSLTQCLSNLVGNAVKFVAPGVRPTVRIWAEVRGQRVFLFVKDNGIGIDPQLHEKIFTIFYRNSRDYEGTGIGLAIVYRAVQRMGGEVSVVSEPGKGSTFQLELAKAPRA